MRHGESHRSNTDTAKGNQINRKYISEKFNIHDYNIINVISRLVRIAVQKRSPITLNLIVIGLQFSFYNAVWDCFRPARLCGHLSNAFESVVYDLCFEPFGRPTMFLLYARKIESNNRRRYALWAALFLLVAPYKTATPACPSEPVNNLQR